MASKYDPLKHYLVSSRQGEVRLTFIKIEEILGFGLPVSARRHTAWWANTTSHIQAFTWMDAGYQTIDFMDAPRQEIITFQKR